MQANTSQYVLLWRMPCTSGVSWISFRGGGGSKYFWKSEGICVARRHAFARGFGGMLHRENDLKWCVLENILLKFCKKKFV